MAWDEADAVHEILISEAIGGTRLSAIATSLLTLTMILSETCATTVNGLESSSFVLALSDTTKEKYLQTSLSND